MQAQNASIGYVGERKQKKEIYCTPMSKGKFGGNGITRWTSLRGSSLHRMPKEIYHTDWKTIKEMEQKEGGVSARG